jgi:transposase-like protein
MEKPRKGPSMGAIPIYDPSFKIAVVREYITGEYSQTQVARKHNISEGTMHHFVKWYKEHFPEPGMPEAVEGVQPEMESGRTKNELEKELAYANLKITALEMLISNAEREMGVDIRKKPGSKPSTK